MRPMRGCKKPRHCASSDEEGDEEERRKLKDLVQRLPCYQGEESKTKKSVEEDKRQVEEQHRQLEKDRKQLKEGLKRVEHVKKKLEEYEAKVEEEKTNVERQKVKVEEDRVKMEKLSKELQSQVECPVCLTLPREDKAVPCCPQGHIVCTTCTTCRDKSFRQANFLSHYIGSKFLFSSPQTGKVRMSHMQSSDGPRPEFACAHCDQECAA